MKFKEIRTIETTHGRYLHEGDLLTLINTLHRTYPSQSSSLLLTIINAAKSCYEKWVGRGVSGDGQ